MLDLTFLLLNIEKEQECLFYGLKVNSFWFVTISFFLFKMNFSLNHTSSTMFKFTSVFRVSSYSLPVVFYDMTKMKQNQNISCYKFIISVVRNRNSCKIGFFWLLLSLNLRDLYIIDMVNSYSNFYHLGKTGATFLSFLLFVFATLYPMI